MVEEGEGPWGALVVIATKTHQEDIPLREYQWSLCVSYQTLNQVILPFTFPMIFCDKTIQDIVTEAKYFISVDMDIGH